MIFTALFSSAMMLTAQPSLVPGRATYGKWNSSVLGGGGYLMNTVFAPSNPKVMYTFVDVGGLYRSDNGGKSWRMLHGGLPESVTVGIAGVSVHPSDAMNVIALHGDQWFEPDGIVKSTNGGKTWKRVLKASFFGNGDYRWQGNRIDRDPKNPNRLVAGSVREGVFLSENNGDTWKPLGLKETFFNHVQFDRTDGNVIYVCATPWKGWAQGGEVSLSGGFFRSIDRGKTWKKIAEKAPSEMFQHPKLPQRLVAIFEDRTFKVSTNKGDTWTDFHQGLPVDDRSIIDWGGAGRFAAISGGPDFFLTVSMGGTQYRRGLKEAKWTEVKSTSRTELVEGQKWYGATEPGKWRHYGNATASINVNPADPKNWFQTDWFAVWETKDAGKSWILRNDGIETTVVHAVQQYPDDPGRVLMCQADNAHFLSTDGGIRYTKKSNNANSKMFAISRKNCDWVYVIGDEPGKVGWRSFSIQVSQDRGQTYTTAPMDGLPNRDTHSINTIIADPNDDRRIWVTLSGSIKEGGGVYESINRGASFRNISQGINEEDNMFWHDIWHNGPEIAVSQSGDLIAISRRLNKVYTRKSGESVWSATRFEGECNTVIPNVSKPGSFLIGGNKGVWRTDDAGSTFNLITRESAMMIAQDQVKPNRIAIAGEKRIMLSVDGGMSFKDISEDLPHKSGGRVAFAGERLIVGSGGSGIFWTALSPEGRSAVSAKPFPANATSPYEEKSEVENLLANGDFEEGDKEPKDWRVTWNGSGKVSVTRQTDGPKSGKGYFRISTNGAEGYGTSGQQIDTGTKKYKLKGFTRTKGEFKEAFIALQSFDKDNKQVGFQVLTQPGSADWKSFTADVVIPENTTNASINVLINGKGHIDVDQLVLWNPAGSTSSTDNLISNGNFEEGDKSPDGWKVTWQGEGNLSVHRKTDTPKQGNAYLSLDTNGKPGYGMSSQGLPSGTKKVTVSGNFRAGGNLSEGFIAIQSFDSAGKQVGFQVVAANPGKDWSTFRATIELPASAVTAGLNIQLKGTGRLDVDNLKVVNAQ